MPFFGEHHLTRRETSFCRGILAAWPMRARFLGHEAQDPTVGARRTTSISRTVVVRSYAAGTGQKPIQSRMPAGMPTLHDGEASERCHCTRAPDPSHALAIAVCLRMSR